MEKKFHSLWSGAYWRAAAKEYTDLRSLCIAALFIGMYVMLHFVISIPIGSRYLKVTFLPVALCMLMCGPLVGLSAGVASDIISYMVKPLGPFFPGYTLSCVLGYLIFGLFLYRQKITVLRLCTAKAVINLFVNVGLGCLWSSILNGEAFRVFFAGSLAKNLILYPFEIVLLVVLIRCLLPVMTKLKLIPPQKKIWWISEREGHGI